ncbi:MAG TPA: alpha-2-macroglobulin [Chiayiivirga sp.]|nr:alpha-2-macroglobulin [Chiayiivirga sp.]
MIKCSGVSKLLHGFVLATLLASLTALVACGPQAPQAPEKAEPVQTAPQDSTAFTLLEAGGEEYSGRPALRLHFSQPLVSEQDFNALLLVRDANGGDVSGSWVLDNEDSSILRFPYVQGDNNYRVSIKPGLSATDGRSLGDLAEREVYSGNLSPVVGFASRGSVLPARGTQGLPVVAVNTREVDVEFFRVKEKSLAEFLERYAGAGNRGNWELEQINRLADSVYANRYALNAPANQRQVSFLPVQSISELREPGVYFALIRRVGSFTDGYETTHFYVTDLGLHARVEKNGLFVHAASLATGQPRNGVELQLQGAKGEILATATSDSDGNAEVSVLPKNSQVLIARQGTEVALVAFNQPALDLSEFPVSGRMQSAQDVYAWSGRDLFRPGEVLQVSALLRDYDGRVLPKPHTLYATLRQPDGRAISTLPLESDALGYYSYQRTLTEDVPTGRWSLEYRLDPGANEPLGRFAFRIEEFLPERLKLVLGSPETPLAIGAALPLNVDAAFLYGAPAAGNRFTAQVLYRAALHPVDSLKGWFFGDPTIDLPKEPTDAVDTTLGEDGKLVEDIAVLPGATAPKAPFDVIVSGSVFESGGRAIRRSIVRTVWPADALVAVRPLFDPEDGPGVRADARFEVVKANAKGEYVAAPELNVKLVRELRDYHWNWVDGSGWTTEYTRRFQTEAESKLSFDGTTPAQFSARVEWGEYRLEVSDPKTGLTMRYPFTAGWSWDDDNQGLDARPDKVKVAFDADGYRAGDTASVTLTAPYDGTGLILVESDHVLYRAPIELRGNTTVKIPVSADFMRHDVYVTALVFRPADMGNLVGPNRAIGVAHFPLASTQRTTTLELSGPELTRPGQPIELALSAPELAGKEAWAVVEAVDLGIINLSGYPVPDAADYFLAQRGLGVEAYDLYSRVIEPLAGEQARLRYGGDAALAALPQARRPTAKVQTVALHHAPVQFDAQGKATLQFTAPQFNGTLRVSALAYSNETYAKASRETLVRAPLVLEVSTPRVMAPGDRAQLTVDLHNLSGKSATYRISTQAKSPISIDNGTRNVTLADNARSTLSFPLSAGNGHGVGHFSVSAVSDEATLTREFEITVRPAWPAVRRSQAEQIDSARTLNFNSSIFDGLLPETAVAQLSIASVPPLPFSAAIDGLIGYPYGCIEQTTSRLWPLVNLDEATSRKYGLEPLDEAKRQRMLDVGFARVAAMQTESGEFSFWPGEGWTDPQMTAYVADILITAKNNGLSIPETVLENALKRLNENVLTGGNGYYSYDHSQHLRFAANAYAGYVLARVNRAPLGSLRALWDNQRGNSLTALPLLQLGIALKLAGDEKRAGEAIAAALAKDSERPNYLGDYGSPYRDEALLLALLYENGLATPATGARVMKLARELRRPELSRYWYSTQERLALFRLGRMLLSDNPNGLQGQFLIDGKPHALSGRSLVSREVGLSDLKQGVSLALEGAGPFWLSRDIVGYTTTAPKPSENGLRVRRAWYRTDGTLFTGDTLTEGDSLIAMITVEADEDVRDALVVDLLPGGIEIENLALGGNEAFGELMLDGVQLSERNYGVELRYEEYRDDRYVAALKLWGGQTARLFYLVRAVSPGTFVVPPPSAEDMYRPQINGVGSAPQTRITVVSPKP